MKSRRLCAALLGTAAIAMSGLVLSAAPAMAEPLATTGYVSADLPPWVPPQVSDPVNIVQCQFEMRTLLPGDACAQVLIDAGQAAWSFVQPPPVS